MTTETQTPGINFTRDEGEAGLAVLASLGDANYQLPTLTDEEIVALDGIANEQAVTLPWLDQYPEQRELLCNVALRTLLTKGLAFPVIPEGESQATKLGAIEPITGVMFLRRMSQRIVITELTKGEGEKVWLYSYVHGDVVLQELVDSVGSHSFSVVSLQDTATVIMELANAAGIESSDGPVEVLTPEEFEVKAAQSLSDVLGVTIITAIGAGDEQSSHYTLYTSANTLNGLEAEEVDGSVKLHVAQVSAQSARAKVAAVVQGGGVAENSAQDSSGEGN
ncbi:hypothetical protein ACQQCD_07025 [Pseudarthrobacter sp. J1763]|uniref:hypothetical protein n=1 Tax=Pseudarthrobacter sp. J1763 TaxID=3420445 RepID=UPI003D2A8D02